MRFAPWSAWLVLVGALAAEASAHAEAFDVTDVQKLWALPFPTVRRDMQGRELIRVRVYPHEQKTPEKRAAEPLDHVTLEGPCQAFVGKANEAASTGRKVGNAKPGTRIRLDVTLAKLKAPLWIDCSGPVSIQRGSPLQTHTYDGSLYIHKGTSPSVPVNPHIQIIAVIPIESYLRGVVPTESIPSWPADALKTQAIAARSFALFNIAHNQFFPNPKLYDVDDTNHFQAFSGLTTIHPNTDAAVEATRGQVLTFAGKIVPGFFDTDHGGQTESAKEVFGFEAPYCAVKAEPPEVVQALKPWSVTVKVADLAKGLGSKIPGGKTIKGLAVAPGDVTAGKRARAVTATLDDGAKVVIPIADFKKAASGVKSALFTLAVSGDSVKIDGKGNGHGVGLNQTGAKALAVAGWTYKKILDVYFKGTTLCSTSGASSGGVPGCAGATPLAH